MTRSEIPLMVIMPVYNEAACIREAVEEVREHILDRVGGAQLTVVNDGSTDDSGLILDEMASLDSRIRVLHKANGGHGDSLMEGMEGTDAEYFMLLDSDRQIPLDRFPLHWEKRGPRTLVSGVRRRRHDPTHRLVLTFLLRTGILLLFQRRLRDGNVPYKILPGRFWRYARRYFPENTLTPSLFLAIAAAKSRRMAIVTVDVTHRERGSGRVSLVSWRLARFCMIALRQLLVFRWRLRGVV